MPSNGDAASHLSSATNTTNNTQSTATANPSSLPNQNFIDRQKAKWKPDAIAVNCDRCNQPFGLLRRKHHCRRCGGVFCDTCCSTRVQLPGWGSEAQRVCKICEAILGNSGVAAVSANTSFLGGMMSRLSTLGGNNSITNAHMSQNANNNSQSSSPNARKPGESGADGLGGGKIPASLEIFPRERRILLIGSPGVGKGSFITTAAAAANNSNINVGMSSQNNNNNNATGKSTSFFSSSSSPRKNTTESSMDPLSSSNRNYNAGFSSATTNQQSSPNNNTNQNFEGFSLSERRRTLSYNGNTYQLVLVNTAGSTVSSELFVHPLLTIGTSAYILMYDVTEPKSFEVLPLLHERLLDCGVHDKAMILLGSKADHVSSSGAGRERVVSKDLVARFAASWKVPHIDVTCTSRESVDHALMELLREIASRDTY